MTQSSISPCSFRERANTWPEGDEHGKKHQTNSEHQVFIKKHSISAIYTDESNPVNILRDNFQTMSAVPRDPIKNICSYLSLGSTLSFSLPQDFMLLNGRDADLQSSEEHPPSTPVLIGSNNQPSPAALPVGSSNLTLNQIPQLALEVQPTLTLQGKSNHETIYVLDKLILDASDKTEKQQHDTHAQGTMVSTKEFCHWEMGKEQDMGQHTSREQSSEFKEALTVVGHIPTTTSSSSTGPSHSHKCLSVHSRIMDLNGHIYHASRYMQWTWKTNSVLLEIKHKPNQLPDSKLGSNKSNRVVFCGERECTVCCSGLEEQSPAAPITEDGVEVPQPSHWQFQEEEEELDDIWRRKVDDVASDWAVERKEVRRQMAYSSHRVHFAESRKEEERLLLVPSYSYPYHKTDLGSASSVSSPLPVIGRSQNCN
ncbi:uncharacterized protein LOC118819338 isoform X2 [Colossoma macropomum]|uniref:uncharacterized protein LOC118819338 isoform X2 n=1 Tax=Colossoma macropomum TaxID=42526 RepID=UPI001863EEC7|nr:uncharacterized protein LOC118819338 isoform X2 [Colossoma macropomum]